MTLPCPICSNVIRRDGLVAPADVTPQWFYCRMSSTREVRRFIWTGCRHAAPVSSGMVEDADRAAIEARWDAEARVLLQERVVGWSPAAREEFERALGFSDLKSVNSPFH